VLRRRGRGEGRASTRLERTPVCGRVTRVRFAIMSYTLFSSDGSIGQFRRVSHEGIGRRPRRDRRSVTTSRPSPRNRRTGTSSRRPSAVASPLFRRVSPPPVWHADAAHVGERGRRESARTRRHRSCGTTRITRLKRFELIPYEG
jgi:hypothetical protein